MTRGVLRRVGLAGLTLALLAVLAFGVAAPPERCPIVTPSQLRASAQASVDWFVRNQHPDGTWLYLYDGPEDEVLPEAYNVVRHAGATMGLYMAAANGLPDALQSADRGTAWALDRLIERDDWAALGTPTEISTGSTALLVAGLVLRREDTGDTRHDDVLRRLGRFLLVQTEPTGAVLAYYDPARGAPVPDTYSKYYTGETYWALALLHRAFPGEGWGEGADRIGAYLATERDDAEDNWPPIADHWAAYGMAETVAFPERDGAGLTEDEAAYARRQAELFGFTVRWIGQQAGPWGTAVRGADVPRGGGYGVIGEALTNWWQVARADPALADLQEQIGDRTTCVAGLALQEQSGPAEAAEAPRPSRVEGAWFRDGETRMDDQQHALAAILQTIPIVEAQQASGDDDAPSGWLWAAALLLALNPIRAMFGIPRAGRSRQTVAGVAAAGTAIGGVIVCVVAALSGPLLDLFDVSDPSFRLAAGIVAILAGAVDLFRRPPAPEPALPGWRAALVPVAIPIVARPALLVLALSAGADHGVLLCAGAMAVGVALVTGLAALDATTGPAGRSARWLARLLAAGLVACGVLLGVDGVYDV